MAGHDFLRRVRGSVMVGFRTPVAGVGIGFVEDIGYVAGVVEDSPGRMGLAVVEVLDHR